jgi:hypothetical protein
VEDILRRVIRNTALMLACVFTNASCRKLSILPFTYYVLQ